MPTFELRYTEYREQHVTATVEADSEDEAWEALDDENDERVKSIEKKIGEVASRFGGTGHAAYRLD
jgi:type II secretory pathway component PulF